MSVLSPVSNGLPVMHSTSESTEALRIRALEILRLEIDFIPNPDFRLEVNREDELVDATLQAAEKAGQTKTDLPAHLQRMCKSELLTHERERALFREMNYLKFRAAALREQLHSEQADVKAMNEIESSLAKAQAIRDHLIQANTRLVMSIVRKMVTPQQSFDDILSDGLFTLMRAVEKFDYDRGFRFSTYAYRAIARNAYQSVANAQKMEARFTRDAEEWAFEDADAHASSAMSDRVWGSLRELTTSLLDQLDRRERFIIRSRYALGAHRKVRTFQYLADKLGVSKERVRQLEARAVSKLQSLASKYDMDEVFGASMV